MRCLKCRLDGVPADTVTCPRCSANLPALLYDVLPPDTLLRGTDYRIEYAIGRGGFGITYRAMHNVLDRLVCIKEFFPHEYAQRDTSQYTLSVPMDAGENFSRGLERFIREGRILARLRHPNVVPVHDLFEERGTAYLIMELIEGQTLKDELRHRPGNKLPPDEVRGLLEQVVAALDTVHRQDVYHLDIKPDNVLLTNTGRAILVDFGAARQGFSNLNTQAFTMDYAPPEIFAGSDVGPASDIYETAIMAHEMLTGARPPNALQRMQGQAWTPVSLEEPWRSLIESGLRFKKEERPQSIQQWWESAFPPIRKQEPKRAMAPAQIAAIGVAGAAALGLAGYGIRQAGRNKVTPTPPPTVAPLATPARPTPDPTIAKNLENAQRLMDNVQGQLVELKNQDNLTSEQASKAKAAIRTDCEKARILAESVLEKDPKNRMAWLHNVSASFYMGDYTGADVRLKQAQKLFPKDSSLTLLRKMTDARLK